MVPTGLPGTTQLKTGLAPNRGSNICPEATWTRENELRAHRVENELRQGETKLDV